MDSPSFIYAHLKHRPDIAVHDFAARSGGLVQCRDAAAQEMAHIIANTKSAELIMRNADEVAAGLGFLERLIAKHPIGAVTVA